MADFAGICVRGRGGGGGGGTYRCDPHPKVYFGQVHIWMIHFGVHPPPRGSPRYTKKLQAKILGTVIKFPEIVQSYRRIDKFGPTKMTLFQRCPSKMHRNSDFSHSFRAPKIARPPAVPPKDTAKYRFMNLFLFFVWAPPQNILN